MSPPCLSGRALRTIPPVFTVLLVSGISFTTMSLRSAQSLSTWLCYFIPCQIFLNWIQFIRHRSFVPVSIENYPGYVHRFPTMWYGGGIGESIQHIAATKERYKDCLTCDMHVPIRSHHCPYCRKCIYILDHHCFFLGHCVGRANLKYFLSFCFYASLGTGYGLLHIMQAMSRYRVARSKEAIFYFFPFSLIMYCTGQTSFEETYFVGLLNFGLGAMLMCAFLFCVGVWSVLTNRTPHEDRKERRTHDNMSYVQRFFTVFGRGGLLHFLCPLLPFTGPYLEPGYRMLVGPNSLREVQHGPTYK